MTFKNWLELTEHRRGPVGGAFGRQTRAGNRFQSMDSRVSFGKKIERQILDALKEASGWDIVPSAASADMKDKIDGYVKTESKLTPIQIKYRDTGDDILMEVEKDGRPGRDMVGMAQLYVVLNQMGTTIRVRSANEAKQIAEQMKQDLFASGNLVHTSAQGQIRMQNDPRDGKHKIIAYIKAESFQKKMDFQLKKRIW